MANNIGWGKAHENNSIDFGAASDATNDFGSIYDSSESGETVIIGGKGPENTVLPAITGTAERGEVLTCSTGTWTGTGTITYAFQWQRNGVDIVSATSNTYTLVTADDNATILCTVTATDDEGSRSANSNSVLSLGAPFNLVAPAVSGTEQVGETLTTTNGTWQGVATITFAYQWRRDSVNIGGETSSTYTLVAADYDTNIDCVITATNSLDSTDQASNSTGAIAGIIPVISGVPTFSGTEDVGEDLTAVYASSSGVPTPTDSIQWQRSADGSTGWVDISGATSLVYTLVLADEGNYVRPVQTSTNAEGSATANGAASGEIQPESVFEPEYQAVLDYATTQGYTLPSLAQQDVQNQLVIDLKAAGVWSKLDSFSVFATDGDSDFSKIDFIRLATMTAVNSPSFVTNQGFLFNNNNTIESGYNPTGSGVNYIAGSASYGIYVYSLGADTLGRYVYADNDNKLQNNSGNTDFQINNIRVNAARQTTGFLHINDNSGSGQFFLDGVLQQTDAGTSTLTNAEFDINQNGLGLDQTVSIWFAGGDLSSEAADLNTAFQTYISNI